MAYITIYFNDQTIQSTDFNTPYFSYRGYYGDNLFSYAVDSVTPVMFTANPAPGCNFTQWVYRLGSVTGAVQYSYYNPVTYAGDQDIFIRAEGVRNTLRPNNFYWAYEKVRGGTFNLTAAEWNALTARINDFRVYKGFGSYNFTYAYKGYNFTAEMYNQAVEAIKGISGYGYYLSFVNPGDIITATSLNMLRDELNAIP